MFKFKGGGVSKSIKAVDVSRGLFKNAFDQGSLVRQKRLKDMFNAVDLHSEDPILWRKVVQLREILSGVAPTGEFDPCMSQECVKGKDCVLTIKVGVVLS